MLGGSVREHIFDEYIQIPLEHPIFAYTNHTHTIMVGPDRWQAAMALYMIGFISYGATLVFYAVLFPRLARNTQHARDLREKYENGEVAREAGVGPQPSVNHLPHRDEYIGERVLDKSKQERETIE